MAKGIQKSEGPLSAGNALRCLAEREAEGVLFYQGMGEGTKSELVRELAGKLLRAEQRHHDRFLAYAERADAGTGEESGGDPIPSELHRLLQTRLFVGKERIRQSAPYASDIEMVKVALRAEEQAVVLVAELAQYVPRGQRPYLARVLKEEEGHKARLQKVLEKLAARK